MRGVAKAQGSIFEALNGQMHFRRPVNTESDGRKSDGKSRHYGRQQQTALGLPATSLSSSSVLSGRRQKMKFVPESSPSIQAVAKNWYNRSLQLSKQISIPMFILQLDTVATRKKVRKTKFSNAEEQIHGLAKYVVKPAAI
jgi:hypothetical protein